MSCSEAASRFLVFVFFFGFAAIVGHSTFADEKTLDLTEVRPVEPAPGFLEALVTRYLPNQMTPTSDKDEARRELQGDILKKVGDDLAKDFAFRTTAVGHLVNNLQKYGTQSVNLMKTSSGTVPLRFQVEAYRATASFKYDGIFNSDLSYIAADKNVVFTISKAFTF